MTGFKKKSNPKIINKTSLNKQANRRPHNKPKIAPNKLKAKNNNSKLHQKLNKTTPQTHKTFKTPRTLPKKTKKPKLPKKNLSKSPNLLKNIKSKSKSTKSPQIKLSPSTLVTTKLNLKRAKKFYTSSKNTKNT